jgi:hypothetical protein
VIDRDALTAAIEWYLEAEGYIDVLRDESPERWLADEISARYDLIVEHDLLEKRDHSAPPGTGLTMT